MRGFKITTFESRTLEPSFFSNLPKPPEIRNKNRFSLLSRTL